MDEFTKKHAQYKVQQPRILVIEDEKRIRDIIVDYLEEDYIVDKVRSGEEGLELIINNEYNLILVDLMLPEMSGFEVCKIVRKTNKKVIIVVLSALGDEENKLKGFECGIDEYVTKPFSPKVLSARIKALVNRSISNTFLNSTISLGYITINLDAREVFVDNRQVKFSKKEYDLLLLLLKNRNKVLTRDNIVSSVWGHDYIGDGRVVDTNVKMIRKKVGNYSKNIKTVIGVGYMFKEDHGKR